MSQADAPSAPAYDLGRGIACALVSVLLGVTQGLGVSLVAANISLLQGALGATPSEAGWLLSAYYAVNVSSALLLVKFRQQFGFRLFADIGLVLFVVVTAAHLLTNDLRSAVAVRAAQGFAAAPLSTLALFYMLDAFPPARRGMAMALGLGSSQMALPLARVVAPDLLQIGQWHGLYLPELGLALMSLAAVNLVRLTPQPRMQAFDRLDAVSFAAFGPAVALLCIVLGQARFVWWTESRWLGVCLAVAVVLLTLAVLIELNRDRPMIDFKWLTSSEMIRLGAAIILFRIVLSEQSVGAIGFLQTLGLTNEQMAGLFWVVLAATGAGFCVASLMMGPSWGRWPGLVALLLIALGAWLDSHATSLTRPAQLYFSQGMMAFAGALFLPSILQAGITRALRRGPAYILSFIVLFSAGQSLGGLVGSSGLGSLVTVRQHLHLTQLAQGLSLADPIVATRVRQLAGVYGHVLTDRGLTNAEGVSLLIQQASREAYVLAYDDLFRVIAALALATFGWFFLVEVRERLRSRLGGPAGAAA